MARPRTEEMPGIFEREWKAAGYPLRASKRPRQFFNGLLALGERFWGATARFPHLDRLTSGAVFFKPY